MSLDDALERARAGDPAGIGDLYRALAAPLLAYLRTQVRRTEDAEDLLGQTFLEAIRDLPRFTGDLSGFRGWLFRIAHHRAVDLVRRGVRRPEALLGAIEDPASVVDAEEETLRRLESERVWRAIGALPPSQREVLTLRVAGGLTSAEIGVALGKRVGAVKALQHRALSNLARALGAYPREPGERSIE